MPIAIRLLREPIHGFPWVHSDNLLGEHRLLAHWALPRALDEFRQLGVRGGKGARGAEAHMRQTGQNVRVYTRAELCVCTRQ